MLNVPLLLWAILFAAALLAPLRWSFTAFLILSVVDFYSGESSVGILNTVKGLLFPLYLLWRLRNQAGHSRIVAAPIAFLAFAAYVALCSAWSAFPLSAAKLVLQLFGSFLICMAFLRGAKAGYLTPSVVPPVAAGALAVGVIRTFFAPTGIEPDRFTGYAPAQSYACFCAALFCAALCAKSIRPAMRCLVSTALAIAIVLDGSRIWMLGLCIAVLTMLLTSRTRTWIKFLAGSALVLTVAGTIASAELVMRLLVKESASNRIAASLVDVYQGDTQGRGLGTYNLRRRIDNRALEMIEASSIEEVLFGHGTSNGALITWSVIPAGTDPNRAVHNEWLRILYEWGIAGMLAWSVFLGSVAIYAIKGIGIDQAGNAQPLVAYLPALVLGLTGENILAGAGTAANLGLILLIAFANISHHDARRYALFREFVARRYGAFANIRAWRPGISHYYGTRAKRPWCQTRPAKSSGFLSLPRGAHPRPLRYWGCRAL